MNKYAIGDIVEHAKFGIGQIKQISNGVIVVFKDGHKQTFPKNSTHLKKITFKTKHIKNTIDVEIGDRLNHKTFGFGFVEEISQNSNSIIVNFNGQKKTLNLQYANLVRSVD